MRKDLKQSNRSLQKVPFDYFPEKCGHWFTISKGLDKGKKMFYRDSYLVSENTDKTILFVHGNPECSYTYRKIIHDISNKAEKACRIVAMDHIGFGLSDQATYEMVCFDHARNLLQLVRYLDLNNITLVIHDWGGPIGIGALLREPERVENLLILNSTVFPISNEGITFRNYPIPWLSWSNAPYIIPNKFWGDFAAFAIFAQPTTSFKLLIDMLRNLALIELEIFSKDEINGKIAQIVYKDQFQSHINVQSSKRLVLQTKSWGHGNIYEEPTLGKRDTTAFYREIQETIEGSWGPRGENIGMRALIGRWDPLGQNNVIKQWISFLPQLKNNIIVYKNVGHFIEEVKPVAIGNALLQLAQLLK
jgi:pimeloyl-ACP methyl ester carboxylesterase